MKKDAPNEYRIRTGIFNTEDSDGMRGMFLIPIDGDEILVTCNLTSKDSDHITIGSSGKLLSKSQIEKLKKIFWEDDELEDLIEFDPSDMIPIKLNVNTIHIKKRANNWITTKFL